MSRERLTCPGRRPHTVVAWSCGVLLLLGACGDGGARIPSAAQFVDSAGVAIVTNPPGEAVFATIAAEPVLSIGAIDGPDEVLFGRIASVAVDGAGNLIVADGQMGEVRIFDASGVHLQTIGGPGEGPGEFRALAGAWRAADGGIVTADSRLRRITRFGPDGELLATATFHSSGERPTIRDIRLSGTGTFLSRLDSPLPALEGTFSLEDALESISDPLGSRAEYLVRHDLEGALIDTVATLRGRATRVSTQGSGTNFSIQIMRVPFSPAPVATASPDGRMAVTTGRSYEFSAYDPAGTLDRIVRVAEEPPTRTEAHLEAWVRSSTGDREPMDDAQVEAALRSYREIVLPDRLPAWNSLVIADGGEVWARRFAIRGAETVVRDVFGSDGSLLGQVVAPAGLRIQHIAGSRLTVISTDYLGVERVEVYELQMP
ncbi:MAG: 6-bladed beta-propeller [Gammaproteobacteria bacterium]|nr:6-bladed beta-propeller [Gammaproteobacteria bacterium]MDE0651130.1 6-bladed beta-propeller [Gammaproteobacteria bacterium]